MSEKIRKLTAEEAAASCAKYYEAAEAELSAEVVKGYAEPMDVSKAVLPEQINEIFGEKGGNGYCMIPCADHVDGAYAVSTTFFPKATVGMLKWWFVWRGLKSVNYTVSDPYQNHSVGISANQKVKMVSDIIPLDAKTRGIIQSVVKDTGKCGLEDFVVHLARPEEMEVAAANLSGEDVAFVGGWWMREDRKSNEPYKKGIDMFAYVCNQKDDGVEVKTFVWCGYRGLKGKVFRMDSYGPVIDEAYAKQIGLSMAKEMAQLATILPGLYADEKGELK